MIAIGYHDTIKITRQRISNFASALEAEALALNEALKLSGQFPETYSTVKIYTDSKFSLQSLLNEQRTSSVLCSSINLVVVVLICISNGSQDTETSKEMNGQTG